MDIDFCWVETEIPNDGQRLNAEGLIQLEEVDRVQAPASLAHDLANRVDGCQREPLRLSARPCLCAYHDEGSPTLFPCLFCARDNQRGCPIAQTRGVPWRNGSSFLEGRLELREHLHSCIGANRLISVESAGCFTFLCGRKLDGQNLSTEAAFHRGCRCAPMRFGSKGVLFFAADPELLSNHLRSRAHVELVITIPKSVVKHCVYKDSVAHTIAGTSLGQQIRGVAHRLHAAGHNRVAVPGLDGLRSKRNGAKARAADLIHGKSTDFGGKPASDHRLSCRALAETRLQYASHDALVDLCRFHPGALHRFAHNQSPKLRR